MTSFFLIFICIASGIILSRMNILPKDSYKSINAWVLYIAFPALALRYIPEIEWSWKILIQAAGPVLVWVGAWIFVSIYSRFKSIPPETRTALIITCGLGNTAFLGFPMISAFYGESEIRNAILFDQMTFLLFSTIAVITILKSSAGSESKISFKGIIRKVFRFPPFLACLFALVLSPFFDFNLLNPVLDKLVATLSPMALFSIGLQLKLGAWKEEAANISAGLLYKLILAPALVLVLAFLLHTGGNLARLSVFEAAMPSHVTASLLAGQYNRNPNLCNLMVGFGIITCFLTTPLWWSLMKFGLLWK